MSVEHEFITSVLDRGNLSEFVNYVKPTLFFDPTCILVWNSVGSYYAKHGTPPPRNYVARTNSDFEFEESDIETRELFSLLQRRYVHSRISAFVEEHLVGISEEEITDPIELLGQLEARWAKIGHQLVSDEQVVRTGEAPDDVVRRYRGEIQNEPGLEPIPLPWEPLQRQTGGARYDDYIVFFARMGNMKTTLLLYLVTFWYTFTDRRFLILTKEMSRESFWDALTLLLAKIAKTRFKEKTLTDEELDELADIGRILKEQGRIHIVQPKAVYGEAAVQEVARLASYYGLRPGDVIAIDGLYFYGNNDPFTMRKFSSGLRQFQLQRKFLVVGTNQGNQNFEMDADGDPGKMSNLGDALPHDATMMIAQELNQAERQLELMVMKLREGLKTNFVIDAQPYVSFELKFSEEPEIDSQFKVPKMDGKNVIDRLLGRIV